MNLPSPALENLFFFFFFALPLGSDFGSESGRSLIGEFSLGCDRQWRPTHSSYDLSIRNGH